jgi:hypothetical protein
VLYILIGLFFVVLEHKMNETDFTEMSRQEALCVVGASVVHYLRLSFTYPFYLAEDGLLLLSNRGKEGE